jgi:hypothetical protein
MANNQLKWPHEVELQQQDIEKFLAIHGKRGIKTLNILGEKHEFYKVMKSEIGQMILRSIMVKMEYLLDKMNKKIRQYKDVQIEMIAYNTLSDLFLELIERIQSFEKIKKKIKST